MIFLLLLRDPCGSGYMDEEVITLPRALKQLNQLTNSFLRINCSAVAFMQASRIDNLDAAPVVLQWCEDVSLLRDTKRAVVCWTVPTRKGVAETGLAYASRAENKNSDGFLR